MVDKSRSGNKSSRMMNLNEKSCMSAGGQEKVYQHVKHGGGSVMLLGAAFKLMVLEI